MEIKKLLKKLSIIIIGLCFATVLVASVGAISPVDLLEKFDGYQAKASILNDYDRFIKAN